MGGVTIVSSKRWGFESPKSWKNSIIAKEKRVRKNFFVGVQQIKGGKELQYYS
jgi:hypothetical protein